MAHEILGERFMSRTEPAWHGLGRTFPENTVITASEAARQVAGDLLVEARPLFYMNEQGQQVPVSNYTAIVRGALPDDPQEKVFGVTTEKWHKVSYPDMARTLDELSKTYRVETCGLIKEGALCFLALKGPDFDVRGDRMQDYFIANLSNMPGVAHKVMAAPVRVVCNNTNLLAERQASINLAVSHGKNAKNQIGLAATLVAKFREITSKSREVFDRFAATPITNENLRLVLEAAWPDPPMPTEVRMYQMALQSQEEGALQEALGRRFNTIVEAQDRWDNSRSRIANIRLEGESRFEAFEPSRLRGTVWAAYNAVTELADWREGRGADEGSVWGARALEKTRAFAKALELGKS